MARTKEFEEEEALEKAMQLFWTKGYNATSMQDIVDALGLSRSSIYDTFGDKEKLFLETLKKYNRQSPEKILCMIEKSTDAKATLKEIFANIVEEALSDSEHKGCFVVNVIVEQASCSSDIKTIADENLRDLENTFVKLLQKGQEAGQISDKYEPRALAYFLNNAILGLRVAAKSGGDRKKLEDIVNITLSVL
jgi:TetR/AcrR family transcriptional repressor of nem operon